MDQPRDREEMSLFHDTRIVAAMGRHSRRRRRTRFLYDNLDRVFYAALLLFALLGIRTFLVFIAPYVF